MQDLSLPFNCLVCAGERLRDGFLAVTLSGHSDEARNLASRGAMAVRAGRIPLRRSQRIDDALKGNLLKVLG